MKFTFKSKLAAIAVSATAALSTLPATQASAGTDAYLGEIMLVGYNFCPRGTAAADGQILPISSNTALFSLFGTMYGGDGRTSFALPDLRSRVPMHTGNGPGLSSRREGQRFGAESVTIGVQNMPSHSHSLRASGALADRPGAGSDMLGKTPAGNEIYHDGPADRTMDASVIGNTGGSQAINTMNPVLVMRYCVALQGVYPSRN
jgi:microcystin-dependent protein